MKKFAYLCIIGCLLATATAPPVYAQDVGKYDETKFTKAVLQPTTAVIPFTVYDFNCEDAVVLMPVTLPTIAMAIVPGITLQNVSMGAVVSHAIGRRVLHAISVMATYKLLSDLTSPALHIDPGLTV